MVLSLETVPDPGSQAVFRVRAPALRGEQRELFERTMRWWLEKDSLRIGWARDGQYIDDYFVASFAVTDTLFSGLAWRAYPDVRWRTSLRKVRC
jgi:hypothetical protein